MTADLKALGIALGNPELVAAHYARLKGVFVQQVSQLSQNGLILDLDALPTEPLDLKGAVIKWLISVNLSRISAGQEPLITLPLVLKCPVWRVHPPPFKRISLTKEGTFNKPTVKTIGKKQLPGRLNKK